MEGAYTEPAVIVEDDGLTREHADLLALAPSELVNDFHRHLNAMFFLFLSVRSIWVKTSPTQFHAWSNLKRKSGGNLDFYVRDRRLGGDHIWIELVR